MTQLHCKYDFLKGANHSKPVINGQLTMLFKTQEKGVCFKRRGTACINLHYEKNLTYVFQMPSV